MKHSKRLKIYKILIVLFIVVAFVWPRFLAQDAEIDNRALAIAIGIDVNNDDDRGAVLASAQILVPIPQGQQVGKQEVFFGTGNTLAEALFYINVKIGRILDFGQVGVIVFGEEKAKEGVLDDLKYLINNKVRAESTLFVAEGGEAREILTKANNLSEEATSSLNNLLKFNAQSTYMPNINMLHFISDSNVTDKTSFIPILNIDSRSSITQSDGTKTKELTESSASQFIQLPDSVLCAGGEEEESDGAKNDDLNEIKDVDRVFLFKEGRLVDKLDYLQTKGLVWHNADAHFGLVIAKNIQVGDKLIEHLPCDLREKSVSSKVFFDDGKPVITYKFKLRFNSEDLHEVNENHDSTKPFEKEKINKAIERALEEAVRNDLEVCSMSLRDKGIDAMRIAHQFYKFRHSEYKKHIKDDPDFLNKVEIRYNFKIKIY